MSDGERVPLTVAEGVEKEYRAGGEACLQYSGDLLRHVGTDATAEDLERIRIALGEDKLTFIGHSAGTLLGATGMARELPDDADDGAWAGESRVGLSG